MLSAKERDSAACYACSKEKNHPLCDFEFFYVYAREDMFEFKQNEKNVHIREVIVAEGNKKTVHSSV